MLFFLRALLLLAAVCILGAVVLSRHRWRWQIPTYGDLQFNWNNMSAQWRTVDSIRYFHVTEMHRETHPSADGKAGIIGRVIEVEITDVATDEQFIVDIPPDIDVDAITALAVNAKQRGVPPWIS